MEDLPTDRSHLSCRSSGIPAPVASSSIRPNTESEDEFDATLFPETRCASGPNDSCGSDVDDELLPELTDNHGTTRGTKLSVWQMIIFGQS